MASTEIKNKTNIGSSTLILIFIILCLATFGLLSLSSAKSDWTLAEKNADAVRGYYEADSEGQKFFAMADQKVREAFDGAASQEAALEKLKTSLGELYREDTCSLATEILMPRGQALHVELGLDPEGAEEDRLSVLVWKVVNREDYEIDNSMPVWVEED